MINKWRVMINWKGIYNVKDPLEKGAEKIWKEGIWEQFVLSLKPLLSSTEKIRRTSSSSDEGQGQNFTL